MSDLNKQADAQFYIGVKQVKAWPEERDGKPGYGVRYPDGYTSWSPKDTFEAANIPMGEASDGSFISSEMVDAFIVSEEDARMGNHTVLLTRLRNGFTIMSESACVAADNYDHLIGLEYCRTKARNEVWKYLGFLLTSARNGFRHQ